jgi:hypothetical protein
MQPPQPPFSPPQVNPAPPGAPASDPRAKVNLPAILIMSAEGIGIVIQLGFMLMRGAIMGLLSAYAEQAGQKLPPQSFAPNPVFTGVSVVGGLFVIFAMFQLRNLRMFPLALIGTLMAMVPIASSCCCLGLPLGIWMLITLFDPEVRAAFT